MNRQILAITGFGMVSSVGLDAPASCAAIRCAIDNVNETRFMDSGGEWIMGSHVPLEKPWRGTKKLSKMLVSVLQECVSGDSDLRLAGTPILVCFAEHERPGRLPNLENEVFKETQQEMGIRFHKDSGHISMGRVSLGTAMRQARKFIYEKKIPKVIVAGVDSLLTGPALSWFEEKERVLTSNNSNGFIPGEAAAAVIVEPLKRGGEPQLLCLGIGSGLEKATEDSETPLRADGLVQAIREALAEAGCTLGAMDFRITDASGGQYSFKEASLALTRILRERKEEFDIWHPADCIGEVGAAIGPSILNVCLYGTRKGCAPGNNILCHLGNEDSKRVAMIFSYRKAGSA